MSFTRVPQPTQFTANGVFYPAVVEHTGTRTDTDTVIAVGMATGAIMLSIRNIDPATRVGRTGSVEMTPRDTRHLIDVLTQLADEAERAGR